MTLVRSASIVSAALTAAIAASLAGCSGNSVQDPELPPSVREVYVEMAADARARESSDAQITLLESAIDRGTPITFEEYKQAKQHEMDCIARLGAKIVEVREVLVYGVREISYLYGGFASGAQLDAVEPDATACEETHALFIELARQIHPTQEERDSARAARTPEFVECLRDDGVNVDASAHWEDLVEADQEHARSVDVGTCFERLQLVEVP